MQDRAIRQRASRQFTADAEPGWRQVTASGALQGTPPFEAGFYRLLCLNSPYVDFLKAHECETLYLVGDIIDGWKLKNHFYWPQEHTNVIRNVLTKSKRGTKVYYVTGNHDEFLRKFVGFQLSLGNIQVVNEHIHTTADGRQLLITHGDAFDVITRYHAWVAMAGDAAYEATLRFNYWFNRARRTLGMRYWSLSAFAKQRVKAAVNVVSTFEESVARECQRRGMDGVVCGHIHHAEIAERQGVTYHNCGDWVESCTALVEDFNGQIRILRWVELDHLNQRSDDKVMPIRVGT